MILREKRSIRSGERHRILEDEILPFALGWTRERFQPRIILEPRVFSISRSGGGGLGGVLGGLRLGRLHSNIFLVGHTTRDRVCWKSVFGNPDQKPLSNIGGKLDEVRIGASFIPHSKRIMLCSV